MSNAIGSLTFKTQNGFYPFNIYSKGTVDVLFPSIIIYVKLEGNEDYSYLGVEYVEIPKAHFQTFTHEILEESTHILVHQIFEMNEYSIEEEKRQLRLGIDVRKRKIKFKYDL